MLHGRHVLSCRALHEPADIAHCKGDVRACVHQVQQAPNDVVVEYGVDGQNGSLPCQLHTSLHGCLHRIAAAHARHLEQLCGVCGLVESDPSGALLNLDAKVVAQRA